MARIVEFSNPAKPDTTKSRGSGWHDRNGLYQTTAFTGKVQGLFEGRHYRLRQRQKYLSIAGSTI